MTLTDSVVGMRFRQLGSSDLQVSEICLGSWLTYGGGVSDDQAEACVAKSFENNPVATQFFLSGLKFFLYHVWVFPVPKDAPASAAE